MKRDNIVREKSFAFAIRIVHLCRDLTEERREYVLSKQLLRSGTAIGALVRESEYAESRSDFVHKLRIALKEANETAYWLDLLFQTKFLPEPGFASLHAEAIELIKLLTSIINRANLNR